MVYMGDKLTMDIHGRDTLEKQFSAFTGGIKASHHQNGQQVITVEGDTAIDVHYCRAAVVGEGLAVQGGAVAESEAKVAAWAKKNLE